MSIDSPSLLQVVPRKFPCPFALSENCTRHGLSSLFTRFGLLSHIRHVHLSSKKQGLISSSLCSNVTLYVSMCQSLYDTSAWMCWNGHGGAIWASSTICNRCGSSTPSTDSSPIFGLSIPQGMTFPLSTFPRPLLDPTPQICFSFLPPLPTIFSQTTDIIDLSHINKLFSLRIPTVKSIPRQCRYQVAEKYLSALD